MTGEDRDRAAPLWAWAALAADLAVLAVAGLVLLGISISGETSGDVVLALSVSTGGTVVVVTIAAALLGARLGAVLRLLRDDALASLTSAPASSAGVRRRRGRGPTLGLRAAVEIAELQRVLAALRLRVRVADDVAERHRRTAETSGAGVFELLAGLVAAEEGARGQLAAELHDTVAQSLLSARMLLAGVGPNARRPDLAADLVAEAEEQVRAVMARTRPPELTRGDLADAVEGLAADLRRRYGLRVAIEWPALARPIPLPLAVVAYRFFQESLLNVVKHADSDDAVLRLELSGDVLVAEVADSGPGFAPGQVPTGGGRHVGLSLLRERARLAGGAVEIASAPGEGTRVELRLPLPPVPVALTA